MLWQIFNRKKVLGESPEVMSSPRTVERPNLTGTVTLCTPDGKPVHEVFGLETLDVELGYDGECYRNVSELKWSTRSHIGPYEELRRVTIGAFLLSIEGGPLLICSAINHDVYPVDVYKIPKGNLTYDPEFGPDRKAHL